MIPNIKPGNWVVCIDGTPRPQDYEMPELPVTGERYRVKRLEVGQCAEGQYWPGLELEGLSVPAGTLWHAARFLPAGG